MSSRRIEDRLRFQQRLEHACAKANSSSATGIFAPITITKGIDEITGVLSDISVCYEIVSAITNEIHPYEMRFALASGSVDTPDGSLDVTKMDGTAFHKASDIINDLKKAGLYVSISTTHKVFDYGISGQINLLLMLKRNWSDNRRRIVEEYERTKNQHEVATRLRITQQAVSKALTHCKWKQGRAIEQDLRYMLENYPGGTEGE